MIWVPTISQSLELRRNWWNFVALTFSGWLCQPDNVRATKFRRCIALTMSSTYWSEYKSSSSKLTMYWPLANEMVRLRLAPTVRSSPTGHLIAIYFNRESTSAMLWKKAEGSSWYVYDHQLLVWPTLIQKTLPELRMKSCSRRCGWRHYWDSTNNFSQGLSQSELL